MRRRYGPRRQAPKPARTPANELERLADIFFEWMAVRNFSKQTVALYHQYLGYFFIWCEERGIDDPAEVSRPVIERYQRHLYYHKKANGAPLAVSTQYTRLAVVRGYFSFLAKQRYIMYSPIADIEMPKLPKRLPRTVLTVAEAEQIIAMADVTTLAGLRDRAILEVLYSTGCRRSELVNLGIYDINHEQGTVFIRDGKGQADRVVPVGERALQWLDKYLFEVRPQLVTEPDPAVVFLTENGEAMVTRQLSQRVREYVKAADIGKVGSCHMFRHTAATLMLENGADVRFIQQMLGHARLETTQIYTRVSISQLKAIHTATHPARSAPHRAEEIIDEFRL